MQGLVRVFHPIGFDSVGGRITAPGLPPPGTGGDDDMALWILKSGAYNAVAQDKIIADTSGGSFTINLPSSPTVGQSVSVRDAFSTWATNNLTVGRNGSNIDGLASDALLNVDNASIDFIYVGGSVGWQTYALG